MHVVVCGTGPVGSLSALLLAAHGHQVTLLGPRAAGPAGSADSAGSAGEDDRGSAGARASRSPCAPDGTYLLLPGVLRLLERELGIARNLAAAGTRLDTTGTVIVSRSAVHSVLAAELARAGRVRLRRRAGATALLTGGERTAGSLTCWGF